MTLPAHELARRKAEDAQHVSVTVTVPYELRHELADWIITEVQKLEAGATSLPRIRFRTGSAAAGRKMRAERMQGRADLWRALYDQVVP